jgi:hypothetical protein
MFRIRSLKGRLSLYFSMMILIVVVVTIGILSVLQWREAERQYSAHMQGDLDRVTNALITAANRSAGEIKQLLSGDEVEKYHASGGLLPVKRTLDKSFGSDSDYIFFSREGELLLKSFESEQVLDEWSLAELYSASIERANQHLVHWGQSKGKLYCYITLVHRDFFDQVVGGVSIRKELDIWLGELAKIMVTEDQMRSYNPKWCLES